MYVRFVIGLAVLAMASPLFSAADIGQEQSPILKKLEEIDQRLDRMERDIREIHGTVSRLTEGRHAIDVRQTPEYRALEKRFRELQEKLRAQVLKGPEDIWQAMGDPGELSRRLDMLVEAFAPTLSEPNRRTEFEQDVRGLKEKIGEEVSEEELYRRIRERLSERIEKAKSEREKAWLQRQLDAVEKSEGPDRKERIARYVRIYNVRATHELAQKYSIPRDQMVKCGLAFMGYGRRPPRQGERPERPGPPRGPTRGTPGSPRDRGRR